MAEILHRVWALLVYLKLKDIAAIVISLAALFVSLRDRRPRLALRRRKGDWYKLKRTVDGREVMFQGVVEAYNVSARANAIRAYDFWCKRTKDSSWEHIENEHYRTSVKGEEEMLHNVTPFALAPYSGAEVRVMAMMKMPQPYEMTVRVEVEDLFGKRYHVEVLAKSS